jgi:diketogulonate reductase-like aldo/keto reductase
VPIPGTRSINRIDENTHAASLPLSADDIADLNHLADRVKVQGNRYNDQHVPLVEIDAVSDAALSGPA